MYRALIPSTIEPVRCDYFDITIVSPVISAPKELYVIKFFKQIFKVNSNS
jgi:hypothetical protein